MRAKKYEKALFYWLKERFGGRQFSKSDENFRNEVVESLLMFELQVKVLEYIEAFGDLLVAFRIHDNMLIERDESPAPSNVYSPEVLPIDSPSNISTPFLLAS